MAKIDRVNKCQYCAKTFKRKSWFLRHQCAKKRAFEDTNDITTQQAFQVYVYWMRLAGLLKNKHNPTIEKFLKSPHKPTFLSIIGYSKDNGLSSPYSYVEWLHLKRIPSSRWVSQEPGHIDKYHEFIGTHEDAKVQAGITVKQIENWILDNAESRTAETFFEKLTPGTILSMVRKGELKPWPLFAYPPIADRWLGDDVYNRDVFYRIDAILNCAYWADKISEEPASVDTVIQTMDKIWEFQT